MPIRGLGTVYAFDLGQRAGWCRGAPGEPPESGSWTLYKSSEGIEQGFANFIACLQEQFEENAPNLVVWAQPLSPQANRDRGASAAALRSQFGFRAILAGMAKRYQSMHAEVSEATARKHFIGQGRLSKIQRAADEDIKDLVLARCHQIQLFARSVQDTDRADACCLHDWATAYYGGKSPGTLHLFGATPTPEAKNVRKQKRHPRGGLV